MSYWENTLSNQPQSNLRWSRYSSKAACEAAQAATGSLVYPDQCQFVDTTPPPSLPPQQPATQPIIVIPPVVSPPATIVQPVQPMSFTDPKIIIAVILVLLFGFLLSRR